MKLTTTIKNFKNNIIGYFSTTKNNGDSSSEGLRVIPFSYLNNKTRLDDFTWDKFVKVEFTIKDFDNLNIRFRCDDFVGDKIYMYCTVNIDDRNSYLYVDASSYNNKISLYVFQVSGSECDIVDNNSILQANDYLTNIIKTSLSKEIRSFNFIPAGTSNQNSTTDILKILSCINVYYRAE